MRTKYRITNKFRFVSILTIVTLFIICSIGNAAGLNNARGADSTRYTSVTVCGGDTLWNLAKLYGPADEDVRRVVFEIEQLNNVSPETLTPGQTILIPSNIE